MNTCYEDLLSAAKEVEETFENVDMYMLNTDSQKKMETFCQSVQRLLSVIKCYESYVYSLLKSACSQKG